MIVLRWIVKHLYRDQKRKKNFVVTTDLFPLSNLELKSVKLFFKIFLWVVFTTPTLNYCEFMKKKIFFNFTCRASALHSVLWFKLNVQIIFLQSLRRSPSNCLLSGRASVTVRKGPSLVNKAPRAWAGPCNYNNIIQTMRKISLIVSHQSLSLLYRSNMKLREHNLRHVLWETLYGSNGRYNFGRFN